MERNHASYLVGMRRVGNRIVTMVRILATELTPAELEFEAYEALNESNRHLFKHLIIRDGVNTSWRVDKMDYAYLGRLRKRDRATIEASLRSKNYQIAAKIIRDLFQELDLSKAQNHMGRLLVEDTGEAKALADRLEAERSQKLGIPCREQGMPVIVWGK